MELPDQTTSPEELLRRAKSGDFQAFQLIVAQLQPRIYRLVYRILQQREDAEDATQQTFLAMVEHIGEFREESQISTWVQRIATNFALKLLRKRRTDKSVALTDLGAEESYSSIPHPEFIAPWSLTPDEILSRVEVRSQIEQALLELDDKYRLVFVLRDIEEFSVRQTAEFLGITEGTVKVRLLRARLALRERLTREFGDVSMAMQPDQNHS
jgi:RNA polymerase sigma-70 factor (ECF subfamily)